MPSNTSNFNWQKPNVSGDNDTWGTYLNGNLDSQDTLIRALANQNISNNAPSIAQAGTYWINNTSSPWSLNIYDGSSWCVIGYISPTSHTFTVASGTPYIGDFKLSAQAANHGSWLLCNGQSLSTTTYSGLFAVIGYTYGGSGSSFNAPNLQGQVAGAIGTGSYSGASTRTSGQFVGEEAHTLTVNEMPAHNHAPSGGGTNFVTRVGNNIYSLSSGTGWGDDAFTANTGGSAAHNNMQPTTFVGNFFIYSGV